MFEIAGTPGHTIRFQGTFSWDIPQNTMGCFRTTARWSSWPYLPRKTEAGRWSLDQRVTGLAADIELAPWYSRHQCVYVLLVYEKMMIWRELTWYDDIDRCHDISRVRIMVCFYSLIPWSYMPHCFSFQTYVLSITIYHTTARYDQFSENFWIETVGENRSEDHKTSTLLCLLGPHLFNLFITWIHYGNPSSRECIKIIDLGKI